MKRDQLIYDLDQDEAYRRSAYLDDRGYLTIGIGRMIDAKLGGGLSREEADYLLANDIRECYGDITNHLPWFYKLDDVRQNVLLNMRFNLGAKLYKFVRMLAAAQLGDFVEAAAQMRESDWFKQVGDKLGERGYRLALEMETGQFQRPQQ